MSSCIVEVPFELKVRTNKGKEITQEFTAELEVGAESWFEECHGYHAIVEPNEEEIEQGIEKYIGNLTLEDVKDLFEDSEELQEDEYIVELVEAI